VWRSADVLRAAALVLGVYLAARLLWIVYPLLFLSFLGVLFGLAVARGADWLERWRIPRGIGSTLIVLVFLGLLAGLGAWAGPTFGEQLGELRTAVPQAIDKIEAWRLRHRGGFLSQVLDPGPQPGAAADTAGGQERPQGAAPTGNGAAGAQEPPAEQGSQPSGQLTKLPETLSGQLGAVARYLFSFLSSTVAVVSGMLLILFMSIYIGSNPGMYYRGLLHLVPHRARPRAAEVLVAIGMTLRRWLVSQLVAMVVIGVVTTIALKLIGVKAAFALGILAGLLEFVPMVGPLLSAIPAVAMGFLDSPQKALLVALAYVAIQFLENHILIPMLMKEGVDLPPVLTLIGLALMGIVFGFLGMLIAVPFLAAVMVAVKLLYVEDVVGDDVDTVLDSA
jgi:predicted PurR-regulated permease PerM